MHHAGGIFSAHAQRLRLSSLIACGGRLGAPRAPACECGRARRKIPPGKLTLLPATPRPVAACCPAREQQSRVERTDRQIARKGAKSYRNARTRRTHLVQAAPHHDNCAEPPYTTHAFWTGCLGVATEKRTNASRTRKGCPVPRRRRRRGRHSHHCELCRAAGLSRLRGALGPAVQGYRSGTGGTRTGLLDGCGGRAVRRDHQ